MIPRVHTTSSPNQAFMFDEESITNSQ
jgi:hypothetical protein